MSYPPVSPHSLDTRVVVSSLWIATMMTVAFVDIFGLYRPDIRAQIGNGQIYVFEIGQGFLFGAIVYVIIPTLMIPLSLLLPRRANRIINMSIASLFLITVIGGAIGEWGYYVLGSAVEAILLVGVIALSSRWTRPSSSR
jgi:hypothetical protein